MEAGLYASVQDAGRPGLRRLGVAPGGVLDYPAAAIANLLVGNAPESPVLEIHFPAPRLRFAQETFIALGGADFSPTLDGRPLANWRRHRVRSGQQLSFGKPRYGRWAYLAFAGGGLATPRWFGSAAMTPFAGLDGLLGRPLRAGDVLPLPPCLPALTDDAALAPTALPAYARGVVRPIRVVPGPEFNRLAPDDRARFFTEAFTVGAASNRMATRLEGARLRLAEPLELVSSAVACGVIQLPPDGRPTVLLADAHTVGGYPRAAFVIAADLPDFVQRPLGATVHFQPTTIAEAERAATALRRGLAKLTAAVALTKTTQRD
ncbi:MAG: biotin-dependent carboxyltransferase family protein [Acidobacteriota bacterium]|nr:biotin-dependent carboxyltransferase family protein [Acidobacteriota bacterium]